MKRDFRLGMTVAFVVGMAIFGLNQSPSNALLGGVFLALMLSVVWLARTNQQFWLGLGILLVIGIAAQHLVGIETRVPRAFQLLAIPLVGYFFWMGLSGVQHDEYMFKLQDQGKLWGLIIGLFAAMFALNLAQDGSPIYWMSLGAMVCGLLTLTGGYLWAWWNLRR